MIMTIMIHIIHMISIFVIILIIIRDLTTGEEPKEPFATKRFLRNRLARLLPMYILTNTLYLAYTLFYILRFVGAGELRTDLLEISLSGRLPRRVASQNFIRVYVCMCIYIYICICT